MTGESRITKTPTPRATSVSTGNRVLAGLLATGCLSVLILAAWLSPSEEGHGTHTQLGLKECTWASLFDMPCPSCGMTTAFAHTANGSLLLAAATQPMGFLLAITTAVVFWGALHVAVFGSGVGRAAVRLLRPRLLWTFGGAAGAAWAYKIITWPAAA